jgi:hypothetical protein
MPSSSRRRLRYKSPHVRLCQLPASRDMGQHASIGHGQQSRQRRAMAAGNRFPDQTGSLLRNKRSVVHQRRGATASYKIRSLGIVPILHRGRRLAVCGRRCDLRARGTRRYLHNVPPPPLVVSSRRDQTGDAGAGLLCPVICVRRRQQHLRLSRDRDALDSRLRRDRKRSSPPG